MLPRSGPSVKIIIVSATNKSRLIVFTGPSGVGKGTIVKKLFADPRVKNNVVFSVSATTRKQREGEADGVNYFFRSREEFEAMIAGDELLEWAEFVGNYYGTPRKFVEDTLASGKSVFLEIEAQGALQIMDKFPRALTIFLMPPSFAELERRLRERGTEAEEVLQRRLAKARDEMGVSHRFSFKVVNDNVGHATAELEAVFSGAGIVAA